MRRPKSLTLLTTQAKGESLVSDSQRRQWKNLLAIIIGTVVIKSISLAFVSSSVGGNLLDQLSTKWDSTYYVSIAQNGYTAGSVSANYAFAPGYPAFIWLVNLVAGNYLLSAVIVSNVFSLLAVVVFYYIAKMYFAPSGALLASLALAFFPTYVTYGLVAYSEPVYLFFAMLAVYFFLKGKYAHTGITASVAVLSGYASLLIPVALLSIIVLRRIFPRFRSSRPSPDGLDKMGTGSRSFARYRFVWLLMPLLVFGLWLYVLDLRSGVTYSLFVAQKPWGTSLANPLAQFQAFFTGIFSTQGNPVEQWLIRYPYTLSFFALAYPLWRLDKELSFYSSAFMLFVLSLVGTAYASGPRLMLSAWPVLLIFGRGKKEYVLPVLVLFIMLSLQSTYAQLTSFWT